MKDDRVYLQHIRDALDDIATYADAGREAFFAERMRQDATIRKLQVIGQAVKNLSDNSKSRQPHISWKQIAGLRDKVIHDYFGVNLHIVWAVIEKDLPTLRRAVDDLLNDPDSPSLAIRRTPGLTSVADEVPRRVALMWCAVSLPI